MNAFKYGPALGSFKGWLLTLSRWRSANQFHKRTSHERRAAPVSEDTMRTGVIERVPDPQGEKLEAIWETEWKKNLMDAAIERVKRKVGARQHPFFQPAL